MALSVILAARLEAFDASDASEGLAVDEASADAADYGERVEDVLCCACCGPYKIGRFLMTLHRVSN